MCSSRRSLAALRHADALYQVVQYCLPDDPACSFIFCQCPWHRLINIFVAAFEQCKDLCDRICHTQLIHLSFNSFRRYSLQQPSDQHLHLLRHPYLSRLPPKYLFVMEMVRFTRLPSVLARSEFRRSTISSHEITPSFSNGISCSTK